ncbi:MAG: hypothetical protein CXT73_06645 [Methanobacteriota archaeon]|jgi:hypothetical protein|nr:MAG: hypothetical protein CXT73_06645 [Euryarchaeota archaeon]
MANAWLAHVKKTREANPGMMFKHVLQLAGKSWKKSPAKKQSGGSCGKALGNTHGGDAAEVAEETGGMGSRDSGVQPDSPAMANEMVGGRRRRKSGKKSKKSKKAKKGGKTKKAGKKSRKNKKSRKSRK